MTLHEFKIWYEGFKAGRTPNQGFTAHEVSVLTAQIEKLEVTPPIYPDPFKRLGENTIYSGQR